MTRYIFLIVFLPVLLAAQHKETIDWKTWSELEVALEKEPKPVLLFFNAQWCEYCKKMERVVFKNQKVVQQINNNYYALSMDVETKDKITFYGDTFINKQAITQPNGVHEIALLLGSRENRELTLPVTIMLDKDFKVEKRIFEYYTSAQLLEEL